MITPQESYPELAKEIGVPELYFKREDLHPLKSHKGRSIPVMIDTYLAQGIRHFVISSSGNAALAAGLYVQELNKKTDSKSETDSKITPITLEILVGQNINTSKLQRLQDLKDEFILVTVHERPLQVLFTKTQDPTVRGLRQSNDDTALLGYKSLAEEINEIKNKSNKLSAVFIGTSSGTTAQALAQFFQKENIKEGNKNNVEIHIVQTTSCHPISDAFDTSPESTEKSLADAIVDHTAFRKNALVPLIESSGGRGWAVSNDLIVNAQSLAKSLAKLTISPNSALSVAGLMEAVYTGHTFEGAVVCLICGE